MSDVTASVEAVEEVRPVELSADLLDDQLIGQLVDRARASGLQLTGEGGLLQPQEAAPLRGQREERPGPGRIAAPPAGAGKRGSQYGTAVKPGGDP